MLSSKIDNKWHHVLTKCLGYEEKRQLKKRQIVRKKRRKISGKYEEEIKQEEIREWHKERNGEIKEKIKKKEGFKNWKKQIHF